MAREIIEKYDKVAARRSFRSARPRRFLALQANP
jgi:hypothetical protein